MFGGLIVLIAFAHCFTKLSRTVLFWMAFVLTRPFGATPGDSLTKPASHGGPDLGTFPSTLVLAVAVVLSVAL